MILLTSQEEVGPEARLRRGPDAALCYQTCKNDFSGCNSAFAADMNAVCKAAYPDTCPYTGVKAFLCPGCARAVVVNTMPAILRPTYTLRVSRPIWLRTHIGMTNRSTAYAANKTYKSL